MSGSLRNDISRPYSYLILVLSVLLIIAAIIISYQSSLRFIRELELEHSENLRYEILHFLDSPFNANQQNRDLYELGVIQDFSPEETRYHLTNQYNLHGDLTLIGMGLENGTYYDLQYLDGTDLYSSERDTTGEYHGWRTDNRGEVLSLDTVFIYDHRLRPWYSNAKKSLKREPAWTPIYISINPKSMFLSATHPIYSESQEFLGLMVSSLSLTEIGDILRIFKSIENADIFILEKDGSIVASTLLDTPFKEIEGEPARINVADTQGELLTAIFQSRSIVENDVKLIWIGLKPYFVGLYPVNDKRGIDWQMYIVDPAYEMLREIGLKIVLILTVALLTIVMGIWIGKKIGIKISEPILEIKNAANQIVEGNLKERVKVFNNNEVGEMGASFNKMGERIYDLVNHLEGMVDERTKELELSKKRLSLHVENTPLAVIEWDEKFNIFSWNRGAEKIFGYKEEEVVGIHSATLLLPKEEEPLSVAQKVMDKLIDNSGGNRSINRNVTKDGRIIHCDWYNTTLTDSSGKVYGVASLVLDITLQVEYQEKQDELQKKLESLSQTDGLTGIANRRSFDSYLKQEWNRGKRNKSPLSFIIADIDFFKDYNDRNGHLAGDQCLKKVAEAIEKSVQRPADFVFRYGGEEFVCLLPETDAEGCLYAAEMMQRNIASLGMPHEKSNGDTLVSLSFGLATMIPHKEQTPEDLINLADGKLYDAKGNGRNQICFSSKDTT